MFSKFTRFLPNPLSHIISISHSHYDQNEYHKHIGKVMTKKTFFKKFPDYKLGKVMNPDLTDYDYTYNRGLNVTDHFIPVEDCDPGGFYLTDVTKLHYFYNWGEHMYDEWGYPVSVGNIDGGYGENIATISLPDDALIYLEHSKIKVDKLVLHEITPIKKYYDRLTEQDQLKCIQENPYVIKFISHPLDELQIEAIKLGNSYDSVIPYINDLSYNALMFAVTHDIDTLSYVKYPETQIQLMAVKHFPLSIRHIRFPCKEVQLEAVKQDVNAIYYINGFPHIEAILLAIKLYMTK